MLYGKTLLMAALAGVVAAAGMAEQPNMMAARGGDNGLNMPLVDGDKDKDHDDHKPWRPSMSHNHTVVTTTKVVSSFTTFCPEPTTVCIGTKTFTVVKPTTLTITDCPCTITEVCHTCVPPPPTKVPPPPPKPTKEVPVQPTQPPAVTTPVVVIAGSEGRTVAYGLAMAAAGAVGYFAL
ncbi:Cell wall protein SED1 [Tolypocladium ophioglossoides CBS 100239]|uniref:Cell wall protein SED1 n=1 Tax=Tolypocladium ophioglossoides (strain CBS 100239) TaxID=1163406 RepID=A0A0L0N3L9_TOLOC|nr:Cell wall protein SED1 [Tolypocladium ophioglossoides CBS 100239]